MSKITALRMEYDSCFLLSVLLIMIIGVEAEVNSDGQMEFTMCSDNASCNPLAPASCKSGNTLIIISGVLICYYRVLIVYVNETKLTLPEMVLCIDNTQHRIGRQRGQFNFRLAGCPGVYSSTTQNTSGVCIQDRMPMGPGKDLYLNSNRMVAGIHTFDCLNGSTFVTTHAIVGKFIT